MNFVTGILNVRFMIALAQTPVAYDATTGKVVGHFQPLSNQVGTDYGGAFSPDGKIVAAIFQQRSSSLLVFWDFETGSLQREFELPGSAKSVHFCNDRFLLAGDSLFDLKLGSVGNRLRAR